MNETSSKSRIQDSEFRSRNSEAGLRGFWALFVTQFQGAFSDNVLKNLVVFMLVALDVSLAEKHKIGELVGALFSLPFILFSMAGGFLADRCSKRTITISVKIFEVFVMLLALVGLIYGNIGILLGCVFMMGMHSAFFGPSKYGSLPELLPDKKLSWGNGLLELGTFMAIILGTVTAALMAEYFRGERWLSGVILVGLAFVGLTASLGITRVPAADPAKRFRANFVGEIFHTMRSWRGDRPLVLAVIGNTYFNFLGALLLLNLFFYGADVLRVGETQIGLLNVALALGIGLGSVAAGYLSGGKIEYGLVPLGALGLSAACVSLGVPGLSVKETFVRLALLGFAGGFFIVPISALLQHRPAKELKGEVLAAANLLSFVGVFLASGAHWLLAQWLAWSPGRIFLVGGVLTLAGGIYAIVLLPDSLLRFVLWCATHTVYRIRVAGRDNIPTKGGALFVCNHVSWVDAVLLLSSTDRPVRFLMSKEIYEERWINPFCKILGVIPISSEQRPRELIQSLKTASEAIRAGEVVCIFAEGEITRIGQLLPFRRGFERIMKDVDAPIIPIALDGVLGSPGSFKAGKFVWKLPRRIPFPVTVSFGKPLPPTATPVEVRTAVQELLADAWASRRDRMQPLQRQFVRTARRHPHRFAMADAQTPGINFGAALVRSVFLARRLKKIRWGEATDELVRAREGKAAAREDARPTNYGMVGIFLPPSVPGVLVNHAAMLCDKVPVNLNYTLSEESLASCVRQCDLKTVVTSRAFLEKIKLTPPGEIIFLEDLAAKPTTGEKLVAFFMAKFLPVCLLERALSPNRKLEIGNRKSLDDLATVIFSSGSTGEPKGVMLSHYNIGSNVEQLETVFGLTDKDRILGILPLFHSFGFTGTLCLPAAVGVGVVFHPNPLDTGAIGPLVREHAVTFLLATPTFLQLYLRGCAPGDFGSLRLVMTGAEKLPDRLATAFEEHFGIRPLEGYGCTECAPVVAVNTPDFRAPGFRQVGGKRGTIGLPLPGVCVRVVDVNNPRSQMPLPLGESGLLLVRGPNVMRGYLGQPEKTAEVLHDGWYETGDIAVLDEDGFLQITDRLSRFSKIGGEMVPHIKVEEKLHELAGVTEQTFVVTGVPDEKKGERLVVLVLKKFGDAELAAVLEDFAACDLPNLWKPKADAFHRVENFPVLGTGKLDLRKVREAAEQLDVA